ncbi:fimbria/pilus periplasmic chaperone [Yersinia ruckeri]|uniref:fimbria/pilus periplasmic chaperone n=1 Tax=Yersinia ruckeri TaxID=29486 RepID=UPI0020BD565B|nr:fimbria/pilus periplasmic chaperone [Yersinia ruckeri]ELM3741180.1 fimbria/pilus periplasmic chaperone [Yersinia ruckeri]MCK8543379.1 fimbria/pilus periplasmic chaperone [Yersinia ruckeri]MCK8552839.1 fimbria/pilus periplasmic chaperone [Yersinia ruckeri]MCW6519419.1 fimbria/pilus periplasmic chaperone [Yersinia ruckeri]MCW6551096.1 fimbria/pilus periplasmic chaperone [Yersinia ruckeri]
MKTTTSFVTGAILLALTTQSAFAALALDRTRIIYDGSQKSLSLNVSNENKQLPYLAQGWIEDAQGNKITTPLTVLPPVQRIEPGAKSQIKVQGLPAANLLSQDRESLFYFNLREIPPRSDKPNTLQIALQTRIKLFYRPKALMQTPTEMATPWQEQITLTKQGGDYKVHNPTPYFITLVDASSRLNSESIKGFEPLMLDPKSSSTLKTSANALGNSPVLTYINDYGGRPKLQFSCSGTECEATPVKDNH